MSDSVLHWDKVAENITFQAPVEFDKITTLLPLSSSILDFGCGYGRITKRLTSLGYSTIKGYDRSEKMIERARKENPGIRFTVVNTTIPDDNIFFDGVICSALFTCIPIEKDKMNLIKALSQKIKRNGYIFITEYSCNEAIEPKEFVSSVGVTMKFIRISDLRRFTTDFNEISCKKVNATTLSGQDAVCLQYIGKKK